MERSPAGRFERMVDRSGIHHLWTGATKPTGVGMFRVEGRMVAAPRVAWELTHGPLPAGARVLRCPDEPACVRLEHLRLLGDVAVPEAQSRAPTRHNLPVRSTSFVGREAELAETADLIEHRRLVTFIGAGGCGKTRLAVELALATLGRFQDGVRFVDLTPVFDAELVPAALLSALGIVEVPGESAIDTAVDYLSGSNTLVVLDNCEHVIDACAPLVEHVVRDCPHVRVLATSREPLGADGEATYRVPSLDLPSHAEDSGCASVALFADRAALAHAPRGFAPEQVADVVSICTHLDGIPLAIELAAARCRVLTPGQIAEQLSERLGVLAGPRRGGLPRHRTLETSIDWSYGLLSDEERRVLRRLSVFSGGFTLRSAEVVCADPAISPGEVSDLVTSLVERSLIEAGAGGTTPRFRLLETIRQYLARPLAESGEEDEVRQRHAAHFVDLAETTGAGLLTSEVARSRALLDAEIANIRAADDWLAGAGATDLALRLHGPLRLYWSRDHASEGCDRIARAMALPGGDLAYRARGLLSFIEAAFFAGRIDDATAAAAAGLEMADQLESGPLRGEFLSPLGLFEFCMGNEVGRDMCVEALRYLDEAAPLWLVDCLWNLGLIAQITGETSVSSSRFSEALAISQRVGNPAAVGTSEAFWGLELVLNGEFDRAERLLTDGRTLLTEVGDQAVLYLADAGLARLSAARGRPAEALARIDRTLAEARRRQQGWAIGWLLWCRVLVEHAHEPLGAELPSLEAAVAVMEAEGGFWLWGVPWCGAIRAERLLQAGDVPGARAAAELAAKTSETTFAGRSRHRVQLAQARVRWAEGTFAAAEALAHEALRGASVAGIRPETIEALELVAGLSADTGRALEAARLFAAAASARAELRYVLSPTESPAVNGGVDRARAALTVDEFEAAWSQGTAMTLDDAVAYASRGRGERKRPTSGWESLTPTEHEVVRLVAQGLRNADIAKAMFASQATVKTHLVNIFRKLEVASRAELAVLASRRN